MATEQASIRVRPGYKPDWLSIIGIALVVLFGIWLLINFIKTPADFYDLFLIGLTNGAIYGLVAIGYSLVYGILGDFKIDDNGDTTLGTVGVWQVKGQKGVFQKTITPELSFVKGG